MAITNPYYEFTPEFTPGTKARAEDVNRQYQAIQTAFDFLPGTADAIVTGTATFAPETGTGNAYVVTMPDTRTSNQDGDQVVFYATHTNTGAATLAVDAIGAVNFVNWDGDPFTGGEIISGRLYSVRYDATGVRFILEATLDAALQVEWAEEWAQQLEDVPVSVAAGGDGVTDFSAYHWAQKSQASAVTGRINTDLATATPPTNEAVTGYLEIWDQDDTDLLAQFGYDASNDLLVRNKMRGGVFQVITTTAIGGVEQVNAQSIDVTAGGLQVNNQLTAAGLERVLTESDKPTAGVNQGDMLSWDTGTSLYVPTSNRVQTFADGLKLFSDEAVAGLAGTNVGNRIEFWDADQDSHYGYVGYGDKDNPESPTIALANYMLNSSVQLRRTNNAGTLQTVFSAGQFNVTIGGNSEDIYFSPGGGIVFAVDASGFIQAFSSGLEVMRSTAQSTGGLQITQTYNSNTGTRERVLVEADLQAGYRLYMGKGFGTTATDPGASLFKWNNADYSLATEFYISATDEANWDADVILGMVTTGDHIIVSDHKGRDEYLVMEVTGTPTDNLGWWTIPVSYLRGVTLFTSGSSNDPFIVEFTALGDLNYADPAGIVNVSGNWTVTGNWTFDNSLNDVLFEPLVSINMRNQSDTSQTFIQNLDGRLQFGIAGADFGSAYFDIGSGSSFAHTRTPPLLIKEQTNAEADVISWGQVWVKDDAPNTLYFTDDTGVDYPVAGNGVAAGTFANTGFEIRSAGLTLNEPRLIEFTLSDSTVQGTLGYDTGGGDAIRLVNNQGGFTVITPDLPDTGTVAVLSAGPGASVLRSDVLVDIQLNSEVALRATANAAVDIYYDNVVKLSTRTEGAEVLGGFYLVERTNAEADEAAYGQIWVKDSVSNMLMFTDDTGVDHRVGVEIKVKTADESITNDANPNDSDDNHLTGFNVDAGGYYAIEGYLPYTQNGGDITLQLTYTTSLTARSYSIFAVAEDGTTDEDTDNAGAAMDITALTDGQDAAIYFKGFVIPAGSGTAKLQWAQGTSSANATTIRRGAWMSFRRIQ